MLFSETSVCWGRHSPFFRDPDLRSGQDFSEGTEASPIPPRRSGSQRPADPNHPWPSASAGVRVVAQPGLEVPEGAALNLSCHLPGGPRPMGNSTFAWFWNGQQLHSEPVPTLAFSYVARAKAGVYYCRAELPTGPTISAPVMLRVLCK